MRNVQRIIWILSIVVVGCAPATQTQDAMVFHVIDGDTIEVYLKDGTEETVRIIGIDTPEYGECFFNEATDYLHALIADPPLTLIPQPGDNRDKYGRLLRYIERDGEDIGKQMIRDGYARNYPWFSHPRVDTYAATEKEAQRDERGLWSACD